MYRKAKLVIEVDGSQHMDVTHIEKDKYRDNYLSTLGLSVLRFNNREVLNKTEAVVEVSYQRIAKLLGNEIPPAPLLRKGGNNTLSRLSKIDSYILLLLTLMWDKSPYKRGLIRLRRI